MVDKEIRTFIKGKNVDILPVNMDHLKLYQKWENNPKVRVYSRNVVPKTVEDLSLQKKNGKIYYGSRYIINQRINRLVLAKFLKLIGLTVLQV